MLAKYVSYAAALAALSMVAGQSASAAVITISAPTADGIVQNGNAQADGEGELRVGLLGNNMFRVAILMFQLPVLAPGETVTNAVLNTRFGVTSGPGFNPSTPPLFNVDLYATRVAAGLGINNGLDWGFGASPPALPALTGTLIQNDLVTPSTTLGGNQLISTNATGNANLLSYINSNYVGGSYIYLRLNPDVAQNLAAIGGNDVGYRVFSRNFGDGSRAATLDLTIVPIPEPATVFVLAGVAGVLGLSRRRRPAGVK